MKEALTIQLMQIDKWKQWALMSSLFLWALLFATPILAQTNNNDEVAQPSGDVYYISRSGSNDDGRTWESAWNELSQVDWTVINPGDVVYIDGGVTEMVYKTSLQIGASGEPDNPIRILASTEPGHAGQIIFFGGREAFLPYCGEQNYDNSIQETLIVNAIRSNDHSYIEIDGMRWRGIVVHGYRRAAIRLDRGSQNVTVRHFEIYNNGSARLDEKWEGWVSDYPGVRLGGANMLFQRVIIHDNGQDAIQSLWQDNNLSNFRLEQSWLYNGRRHPTVDESANYCTHSDGLHIYDGGLVSGVTITETIVGPGFTNNLILGQTLTSGGSQADVQDVYLQDVVLTKAADNNINGYSNTESHNWVFDRVTVHCPNTKTHCIRVRYSDHAVTNSIFVGAKISFFEGLDRYENNCIWNTEGFALGEQADVQFQNVSEIDFFSLDNYALTPDSPCQGIGSRVTSVQQLFSLSNE